ncbi:outer membrane protein assembly factor BamB family protein [Couchioplanes azureus]|uniref:outer membrane protein assembly factor BamB family protein n=1 Tax=Couchioplanes caeruleus TaxID=56438 RepID=UPI00166FE01A|nr:PQQ-binding-like beta-propeller repeat protein [Couchioplanes caeruleus]GGQ48994.1 hypothetical protein GCM10010166_16670 [Couchioplanes caeruleus subsp. azureus]
MSVIDLGLVADERDSPAAYDGPRLRLGVLRRVLAVAAAVLCVLSLTGSARPESHGPRELWSVAFPGDGATFTVGSGMVYVQGGPDHTLTAYGARDGAVRWTSGKLGEEALIAVDSGVVLARAAVQTPAESDDQGFPEMSGESVALDALTGRELWRRPGEGYAAGGGRALFLDWNADRSGIRTLHAVRLHDGLPLWSQPGGGATTWVRGGTPSSVTDRLATIGSDGRVRIRDLAGGRVFATAVVPWVGRDEEGDSSNNVHIDGHTLYVENVKQGEGTITAYDTSTMRRKWRIAERSYGGAIYPCGAVVCIDQAEGVSGFDRDTGTRRWRVSGAPSGIPLRDGGVLVVRDEAGSQHSVIDTATGRRLSDIGSGTLVGDSSAPQEALYVLAPVFQPRGRMAVTKIDDTGRAVLRGAIGPVDQTTCQNGGELLYCVSPGGRLAVTEVG